MQTKQYYPATCPSCLDEPDLNCLYAIIFTVLPASIFSFTTCI
uniref:Uncharacterized protein n=1 Tax=Anguilla anguilla TaxID=7936 RepID=A0A0E9U6I1_ANGAN